VSVRRRAAIGVVLALVVLGPGTTPTAAGGPVATGEPQLESAPQRYVDLVFPSAAVVSDVEYGESVNVDGVLESHYADIYTPTGDTATERPLVIWIHGGAFAAGNRGQMSGFATDSARRGFVSASISYRLRPDGDVYDPGQLAETLETIRDAGHDAQAAVRYFRAHAATYGIDPDRIVVGGYSAGAVTALWANFNEELAEEAPWGDQPSGVSAALSLAGAYGGTPVPGDPPIAMFHGDGDTTVPYAHGVSQCNSQLAAGNVCELTTYDTTHLLSPWYPEIRELTADFLYRFVTCGLSFTDVPPTHAFCADIDWMVTNGLSEGYTDGSFRPPATLTRQAAVAILSRAIGGLCDPPDPGFTDVPPTHPFYDEIAWATENGIVGGYSDGTFRPAGVVTRQALVSFLWNADDAPTGAPDPGFPDVPPGHPFFAPIAWAVDEGIVGGYADGTFRPAAPVTRQAASAFFHRWNDDGTFVSVGCEPF
jgi:acetyl esterase/lipase